MYSKILVPLDGSGRAEAILPHVEELAATGKASVTLLQVIDPTIGDLGPSFYMAGTAQDLELHWELIERAENKAKEYLDSKVGELRAKKIDAQSLLLRGNVVDAILHAAKDQNVDLVAMASHGHSGLAQVFYGSVANGVLHRIDRPLLLVRAND